MYRAKLQRESRAWSAVALAIRYAQARAVHLVDPVPDTTETQRECQARVWQCICSLEQILCVWTGRPSALQSRFTTGHLSKTADPAVNPQALSQAASQNPMSRTTFPEGTRSFISTGWSTFTACLYLDRIVAEVLEELYNPRMIIQAWARVQQVISVLNAKLDRWHLSLPVNLRLSAGQSDRSSQAQRERSYLAFRFYSTRILINWPCLCKTRNINPVTFQSESSRSFNAEAVEQCRKAARDLLKLLPDDGTVPDVYDSTPWWCVLHFVVQAGVIFGLEILPEAARMRPSDAEQLIAESVKAIRWLKALSENSVPARRAWFAYSRLMQLALANAGKDPSMLTPYVPADTSLPSSFASEDTTFLVQHTGYLGL
ncbi:hypothetical protein VTN96DRAFT_6360 [Rasamsonia emersonii]